MMCRNDAFFPIFATMNIGDTTTWKTVNGTASGEVLAGNDTDGYVVATSGGRVVVLGGEKYLRRKQDRNNINEDTDGRI